MSSQLRIAVNPHMTSGTAESFVREARRYLFEVYLPRVEQCVEELTDEQVWWRPNEQVNSIGNLMLHLAGSTRMWIVCGVGGGVVERDREQEFAARPPATREQLMTMLNSSMSDAAHVLENLDASTLQQQHDVRGEVYTRLESLFHAVEHFSMHTGQIILLAKIITGKDLNLY